MISFQVVSYGESNCPKNSWIRIYQGYAMAPHKDGRLGIASEPICVDKDPDPLGLTIYPNDVTSTRSPDYSFIRSTTSVFDYSNGLVPCVACAKS